MEIREYDIITKKNNFKLWDLVFPLILLLGIISGSVYIYKERSRQQEIANLQARIQELQEQAREKYHLQNSLSTTCLAESPVVHAFFADLLTTYAEKFARSKGLRLRSTPLEFGGSYLDENIGNDYREMGRCSLGKVIYPVKQKVASINLNRLYLLNKFGCEKYFTSNPEYGEGGFSKPSKNVYKTFFYSYLDVSFSKRLETCCHELAHYLQYVKWGKSSCESDLVLNDGKNQSSQRSKYSAELAKEHREWTGEIYGIFKGEFTEWERRWQAI